MPTIQALELGQRHKPYPHTLRALADALGRRRASGTPCWRHQQARTASRWLMCHPRSRPGSACPCRQHGPVGRDARERLLDHLRERQVLLVLDNFEHLPAAAPLMPDLLAACPRLALLVTSRTPLRLRGEQRFAVPPLATPEDPFASLATIAASPAVRLFVERARSVDASFELEASTAGAVAGICQRLDGLPLAIELAAARSGLLGPSALLRRLDQRLGSNAEFPSPSAFEVPGALSLLTNGALDSPSASRRFAPPWCGATSCSKPPRGCSSGAWPSSPVGARWSRPPPSVPIPSGRVRCSISFRCWSTTASSSGWKTPGRAPLWAAGDRARVRAGAVGGARRSRRAVRAARRRFPGPRRLCRAPVARECSPPRDLDLTPFGLSGRSDRDDVESRRCDAGSHLPRSPAVCVCTSGRSPGSK